MKHSALGLAVLLVLFALDACAVDFKIVVVKPSREGSDFDAGLAPYKKQLLELGYRSATIESTENISPGLNKTVKLNMASKTRIELTPTSQDDSYVRFELKISHVGKDPVKLNYRVPRGKHTFVVGSSEKHKYLIIIKSVR